VKSIIPAKNVNITSLIAQVALASIQQISGGPGRKAFTASIP